MIDFILTSFSTIENLGEKSVEVFKNTSDNGDGGDNNDDNDGDDDDDDFV